MLSTPRRKKTDRLIKIGGVIAMDRLSGKWGDTGFKMERPEEKKPSSDDDTQIRGRKLAFDFLFSILKNQKRMSLTQIAEELAQQKKKLKARV